MMMYKAFKFRLDPTVKQADKLAQFAGSARFIWNKALVIQKEREKIFSYYDMCKQLTIWKKEPELSWLNETPCHILQQSLNNLDNAYNAAFRRIKKSQKPYGFPKLKKRGQSDSFKEFDNKLFRIEKNKIRIPKLGFVKFRKSRDIEGTAKSITVSKTGKHWFVSIQVEFEITDTNHVSAKEIGIDLGIKKFATFSDGTTVKPLNSFKKWERKLRRAQRSLCRKKRFSNNWKKQKTKVSRIHTHIGNCRKDFLHKITNNLTKSHGVICIEDLQVSKMSQSWKKMNKSILDQGWYEFRRQLEYKQSWRGGKIVPVPPQYTSQQCNKCKHTYKNNRKGERFLCLRCGNKDDADINAAKNILVAGQAITACGNIIKKINS